VVETVGLELRTHHPVFEPVSASAGNGNFRCGDTAQNLARLSAETNAETTRSGQKPAERRDIAKAPNQVRALETGWWAHQGSNLGPDD
jgi:hypothetical protein